MSIADMQLPVSFHSLLSDQLGALHRRVELMTKRYQRLWREMPTTFPRFDRSYPIDQKHELEHQATALLQRVTEHDNNGSHDNAQFRASLNAAAPEILQLCECAGLFIDRDLADGFERSTRSFLHQVRQFDPQLTPECIYQALRNIWIMNSLQVLWQHDMDCLTPMFAYSMLYPYSDNVNDDRCLDIDDKIALNSHFKKWLEGKTCAYRSATEEKIYRLVKMIEQQFPRDRFPGVFQSLLAIFNAQIKSLSQHCDHDGLSEEKLLEISLEKGGTSVLADGYLVGGVLNKWQEDFCFGYGAFLQFADDLQDVDDDLANGHRTLFSQQAERGYLDDLAKRLFHFMRNVVDRHLTALSHSRVRDLIVKNCSFMIQEAISKTARHYSPEFVRAMEHHFPFRFSCFQALKKRLKQMLLHGVRHQPLGCLDSRIEAMANNELVDNPIN